MSSRKRIASSTADALKKQKQHQEEEKEWSEEEESFILVCVPDHLYEESVIFIESFESEHPVLKIDEKRIQGEYKDIVGTGLVFQKYEISEDSSDNEDEDLADFGKIRNKKAEMKTKYQFVPSAKIQSTLQFIEHQ